MFARTASNPIAEVTLGGRRIVYSMSPKPRYEAKHAPSEWEYTRPDAATRRHGATLTSFAPYVLGEESLGSDPEVPPEADFQPEPDPHGDDDPRDDDRLAVFDYLGV